MINPDYKNQKNILFKFHLRERGFYKNLILSRNALEI